MKGTGFGSFKATIVIKVAEKAAAAAQDKTGVAPERREGDEEFVYFVLPWKVSKIGDDETIVFELFHHLGTGFDWKVNWGESEY